MNNKLELLFHDYNVFNNTCELCKNNQRVHSIQYIGLSKNVDSKNREGIILVRPGFAKDYQVKGILQHLWQELMNAEPNCDTLCFLFDMEHLSYSVKTINAARAMYQIIRIFTTNQMGRIMVVNASKQLELFLKVIPLLKIEDLTLVKLEQISNILTHEQLQHLLPVL